MSPQETLEIIKKIKKSHENTFVTTGVTIGLILTLYFYSFASLIDKAPPIFFDIQVVTTLLFIACLLFLKRVAFFLVKLTKGRRAGYRSVLAQLTADDMDKNDDALLQRFPRS
ncbi:MAG: Uncharacterized protein FD130_1268 [Halothiobacillaceae bacterium]|nr:MAG: Uncharacterized protein FD130_1268 [Halothiobacillaceae bacterium]